MIAENPEYFDSPDSDSGVNFAYDPKNRSQLQPLTGNYRNQRPDTLMTAPETPEHDYYNETDLLQKKKSKPSGGDNRNYSRGAYTKPRTESVVWRPESIW